MQNFCEFLYNNYNLDLDTLSRLKMISKNKSSRELIDYLKSESVLVEDKLMQAISSYFEIDLFKNCNFKVKSKNSLLLELDQVQKYNIIPLLKKEKMLVFGTTYPPDLFLKEKLKFQFKASIKFFLMTEAEFNEIEKMLYSSYFQLDQQELLEEIGDFKKIDSRDLDSLKNIIEDAPVVKLLNKILTEAISLNASDIHLEKKDNKFKVRYRIDGILNNYYNLPPEIAAAVISRVKIISAMDITVRHLPQDGKMEFQFQGANYDIRTSVIPTIYGEKAVLRLLLRNEKLLKLKELNFNQQNLQRFQEIFNYNSGIVLLSGPTGSGKTTTLFTILNQLADEKNNIITVENPVEYKLELLNQIEINEAQGLSFPIILRSILRQDPDIIMIGEIRDKETAEIAVRAAITGHLVLSTIHTIDSVSAVSRLVDMGIPPYLIASTLKAVVAQRLLRKLCPECRKKLNLRQEEKISGFEKVDFLYQPVGCSNCSDGYLGRTAIAEVLLINSRLKRLINQESEHELLKTEAVSSGMLSLVDSALKKLKSGITSKTEIMRVIELQSQEWRG